MTIKTSAIKYYFPTIGILIFIGFYIFSTFLYPGGSRVNPSSIGYDWVNNYWCTMFDKNAINGQPNPARPFAILSMIILWISLLLFFFMFSKSFSTNKTMRNVINISSTISILFASLLFTNLHDIVTTISSIFGIITLIGLIIGVIKTNLTNYKIVGIFCITLLGINNYIYYSGHSIDLLPIIQKLTFIIVLSWIIGLNREIAKRKAKKIK